MTVNAPNRKEQRQALAGQWAWRMYYSIPTRIRAAGLHWNQFFRNLRRPLPLAVLETGTNMDDNQGRVVVAGARPWVEYLPRALLEGPYECTHLGSVPLWRLPRTLQERAPSASLCVARVDQISARLLFGPDYLRVPDLVDLWLKVPHETASLYRGKRNSTLRNDLNRAYRNGLACEVSHDEQDLVHFYRDFHVPFVLERFDRFAWPHNLPFLRGHFREGGLVWATHQGQRIAGCVFGLRGRVATALALGTRGGDYAAVESGAYTAILHALIEHAHQLGCTNINFGGSRPLLTDGSMRFKRKWGMRVAQRPQSYVLLLHWQRLDQCLLSMLTNSGLIFEQQGHLSALSVLDIKTPAREDDVEDACHFLRMAGIETLYLCSRYGSEPGHAAPSGTCLIDLASLGNAHLLTTLHSPPVADRPVEQRC